MFLNGPCRGGVGLSLITDFAPVAPEAFERPWWWADAACLGHGPEQWFPERGEPTEVAKVTCYECPVKGACLDYSLGIFTKVGVWGGRSERERRRMRKVRHEARLAGEVEPLFEPIGFSPRVVHHSSVCRDCKIDEMTKYGRKMGSMGIALSGEFFARLDALREAPENPLHPTLRRPRIKRDSSDVMREIRAKAYGYDLVAA